MSVYSSQRLHGQWTGYLSILNFQTIAMGRAGQTQTFLRLCVPDAKAKRGTRRRPTAENDVIAKDATGHRRKILRHWRQ